MSEKDIGMENARKLVELYNTLDAYLQKGEHHKNEFRRNEFMALLSEAKKNNGVIRTFHKELEMLAQIRNMIVHNNGYLVYPNPKFLEQLKDIVNSVCKPPKAFDCFKKKIDCFRHGDRLLDVLEYMRVNDFSQIIVRDGKTRLLTVEGLSTWLLAKSTDGLISLSDTRVGDVLAYEPANTCDFAARNESIFDIRERFINTTTKRRARLFAVIISENGRDTENPLGIATPWDISTIVP